MKYSRVLLFPVSLYLLLIALSTIATKIVGFDEMIQSTSYIYTHYVLGFVASLMVYCYLGFKQTVNPYKQAFLVAAVYWFINLSVSALLYTVRNKNRALNIFDSGFAACNRCFIRDATWYSITY